MAWYKRYGIPFKSRLGTQYMVFISTQTDGSLTRLKGAAEPFTTEENKDDDIFTPMRGQTGTLRVIDETNDGSLLSSLIPQLNSHKSFKQHFVRNRKATERSQDAFNQIFHYLSSCLMSCTSNVRCQNDVLQLQ